MQILLKAAGKSHAVSLCCRPLKHYSRYSTHLRNSIEPRSSGLEGSRSPDRLACSSSSHRPVEAMSADVDAVRENLLSDSSYHIEFNSYLANHVKHAIVALHGLDAPAETIQRYTAVTPYGYKLEAAHQESEPLTEDGYEHILGKKERFPDLLRFFQHKVDDHGLDTVLANYMPRLVQGAAGALTHGIIHAGWGLDGQSRWMTIEGLAYMAYTFVDVHPERFTTRAHPDAAPMDTLLRVADAFHGGARDDIHAIMDDPEYGTAAHTTFHPELVPAGFQWKLAKVLDRGHGLFLELPAWLDDAPVEDALRGMYDALVLLYLAQAGAPGERGVGDFVALHTITALWGAEQVVLRLPEAQRRDALKSYWAAAVAVVASSGAGIPSRDALQTAWDMYGHMHDIEQPSGTAAVRPWPEIVARAHQEEEEHNIKLTYVCRALWRRYGRWHAFRVAADTFTVTPDVGPGKAAFRS